MELALLWLAGAVLVAVWARSKGRSMALAFAVSALLSPLAGAIVVALWQPRAALDEAAARAGTSPDYRLCPACAEPVRIAATRCRHCGGSLAAPAQSEDPRLHALLDQLGRPPRL